MRQENSKDVLKLTVRVACTGCIKATLNDLT